jgi:uncharacterized Zn finger protein
MWYSFRPYVSVAQRRAKAAREIEKRRQKGETILPVVLTGRTIARTFWGKAWCDNLESYSDFENRLPRGRTYVRNGSVVHLQIEAGKITALVNGSSLYKVAVGISPLPPGLWLETKSRCAGQIGSLVELLQGRLSKSVMDIVTARDDGLFPKPREIRMSCSCPDSAGMCKHLAAVLYAVGARLDEQPELLFHLRQVDHLELIEEVVPRAVAGNASTDKKTLSESEVAGVFGIELAEPEAADGPAASTDETTKPKRAARGRSASSPAKSENIRKSVRLSKGATLIAEAPTAVRSRRKRPKNDGT